MNKKGNMILIGVIAVAVLILAFFAYKIAVGNPLSISFTQRQNLVSFEIPEPIVQQGDEVFANLLFANTGDDQQRGQFYLTIDGTYAVQQENIFLYRNGDSTAIFSIPTTGLEGGKHYLSLKYYAAKATDPAFDSFDDGGAFRATKGLTDTEINSYLQDNMQELKEYFFVVEEVQTFEDITNDAVIQEIPSIDDLDPKWYEELLDVFKKVFT